MEAGAAESIADGQGEPGWHSPEGEGEEEGKEKAGEEEEEKEGEEGDVQFLVPSLQDSTFAAEVQRWLRRATRTAETISRQVRHTEEERRQMRQLIADYARTSLQPNPTAPWREVKLVQEKCEIFGKRFVTPFVHWSVLVGPYHEFELVFEIDAQRNITGYNFVPGGVITSRSLSLDKHSVVGRTQLSMEQIQLLGAHLIDVFGDYHSIFWNCQHFAECLLWLICDPQPTNLQLRFDVTSLLIVVERSLSFCSTGLTTTRLFPSFTSRSTKVLATLQDVAVKLACNEEWRTVSEDFIKIFSVPEETAPSLCHLF